MKFRPWMHSVWLLLAVALVVTALVSLFWPQTDEEAVRELQERIVSAVLSEDFEVEWECFTSSSRAEWESRLAEWKRLDPADGKWDELRQMHGLEVADVLFMDAEEFFVVCREGRARSDPDWWATQRSVLRTLADGKLKFPAEDSARFYFDVDAGSDADMEQMVFVFEKDEGEWRFRLSETRETRFFSSGWSEPELELALAEGVTDSAPGGVSGLIVNILADGRVIAWENEITLEWLRERLTRKLGEREFADSRLMFRCDRRVRYGDAAPFLRIMAEHGNQPVCLAVTNHPDFKCRPRTPPTRKPVAQTPESRIDLTPPTKTVYPGTVSAVIEIGPELLDDEARVALASEHLGDRVLLCPSPDAPWEAVVRVLAFLRTADCLRAREQPRWQPLRRELERSQTIPLGARRKAGEKNPDIDIVDISIRERHFVKDPAASAEDDLPPLLIDPPALPPPGGRHGQLEVTVLPELEDVLQRKAPTNLAIATNESEDFPPADATVLIEEDHGRLAVQHANLQRQLRTRSLREESVAGFPIDGRRLWIEGIDLQRRNRERIISPTKQLELERLTVLRLPDDDIVLPLRGDDACVGERPPGVPANYFERRHGQSEANEEQCSGEEAIPGHLAPAGSVGMHGDLLIR